MSKILKGIEQIRKYVNPESPISPATLQDLIHNYGLPVTVICNTYYAHEDNIDAWFKRATLGDMRKVPKEKLRNAK